MQERIDVLAAKIEELERKIELIEEKTSSLCIDIDSLRDSLHDLCSEQSNGFSAIYDRIDNMTYELNELNNV